MPKNTVSIGTQTELTVDNISTLKTELQSKIDEMASLKKAEPKGYSTMEDFRDSEKIMSLYRTK